MRTKQHALRLAAPLLVAVGFVITLNVNAQTVEWVRSAGGTSTDIGFGVAVDAAGNSYVTGQYQGTATFGPFMLTSAGGNDIFVAKYDANGNVLWVRSAGGDLLDSGIGVAVDAAGNSYVTGQYQGTATFGPVTLISTGVLDIFVAKYDTSGNVLWATRAGGAASDFGNGIAVDAAGNSYVTGGYLATANFGPFTLTSAGEYDIFVVKYDTNGNVLWAQSGGGTLSDEGPSVAVDAAGNSYVTGSYRDTATFGPVTLTSAGSLDIFVVKYDGSGNVLWALSAGGPSSGGLQGSDRSAAIAVDEAGNTYVTGLFAQGGGTATFGPFTLTSAGEYDIFVVKYDTNGNVLWAQSAGGTSGDDGLGIALDTARNSYVTGRYNETATFGSFMLTSADATDIFVVKYDTKGNVLWAQSAGGTATQVGYDIAVDDAGNSFVAGAYQGLATFGPFTLSNAGSYDIFVAKYAAPPSTIPTVSEWGLIVLSLLVLTAGTLVYARRRPIHA